MPSTARTSKIRNQAYQLRHAGSEAEDKLWSKLRAHQLASIHFRRQYVIGEYIVDFCAPRKKIIIELDGQPHQHSRQNDDDRTAYLESRGYRVIRFWNNDVIHNIEMVLSTLQSIVTEK